MSAEGTAGGSGAAEGGDGTGLRDAWSEVKALSASHYRVRLGGRFRTAWIAALCSELAKRRISIDQAHARCGTDGAWIAELKLIALAGAEDPERVPYVQLAAAETVPSGHPPLLSSHQLRESSQWGGTLVLAIEAEDSLGLLGSLLAPLAALMLFPIEMHIETRNGRAYDGFWLAGVGARPPSAHARDALAKLLASWSPPAAR